MEGFRLRSIGLVAVVAAALVGGCGGGERQDADEPSGTYTVDIERVTFPERQSLAERATFRMDVRNAGAETIPNVAVTLDGLAANASRPDLADPERPNWVIDQSPEGGVTAYVNTWALGALRPGQTKRFEWDVTAVEAGTHELAYRVAAGLDGKAKAVLANGRAPEGSLTVRVREQAPDSRVDPDTGRVLREG